VINLKSEYSSCEREAAARVMTPAQPKAKQSWQLKKVTTQPT
jgi:hypothetical protein